MQARPAVVDAPVQRQRLDQVVLGLVGRHLADEEEVGTPLGLALGQPLKVTGSGSAAAVMSMSNDATAVRAKPTSTSSPSLKAESAMAKRHSEATRVTWDRPRLTSWPTAGSHPSRRTAGVML